MLRAMYEAAWKEVISDPAAAVMKYQPGWSLAVASGRSVAAARGAGKGGTPRKR
jgi:hypothetical protein